MKLARRTLFLTPALAMAQPQPGGTTQLKTRVSKDIAASPLGIGFETLDRDMFDPERTYSHLAELGVKWARCQTGWAKTEKTKGQFDFAWLDRIVDSLLAIGIQPWFNLGYGNILYTPGPSHPSAVGWPPLNSEEARSAWVRYCETIARRYAKRVKYWEIWNEPNHIGFWQPQKPTGASYVDLVKMTAPVLRKHVPGCTLIGGAFAGVDMFDYFEECYEAGLLDLVDIISYHPYRAIPEDNYEADMRAFRGLMDRYKPGMRIWQGECGAPSTLSTTGALRNFEWDEIRQAKWLLRRVLTDIAMGVEVTSYFHTVDLRNYIWGSGKTNLTNSKGILRGGDYTRKPSYYAYRNACALFDAETKPAGLLLRVEQVSCDLDGRAVRTATFVRKGVPVLLYWYPADLQKSFVATTCRLLAWSGKVATLKDPVLVDLLHGEVHPVAEAKWNGGALVIPRAPLRDYPLVLTDRLLTT